MSSLIIIAKCKAIYKFGMVFSHVGQSITSESMKKLSYLGQKDKKSKEKCIWKSLKSFLLLMIPSLSWYIQEQKLWGWELVQSMTELNGLRNWKRFKDRSNKQTMLNKFLRWMAKKPKELSQKCFNPLLSNYGNHMLNLRIRLMRFL